MTQIHPQPAPAAMASSKPLLEVSDLAVSFDGPSGARVQAVNGVSLSVHPGQTLAVVGESGCGKSVTALSALRLIPSPPGRVDRGSILFNGRDLLTLDDPQMRRVRGRDLAMIFQEPMTSLNPVFTVGEQIIEAIVQHQDVKGREATEIAVQAMHEVGIPQPSQRMKAHPHQFSGGMRQRVMIAMALSCRPKLLLADEPTTALDVTIQAQILDLLRRIQAERGMGIMLITHDLGIVAQNADVVCVMYAGRVVEYANVFDLFDRPLHPYTRALLKCRPKLNERIDRLRTVEEIMSDATEMKSVSKGNATFTPWWPTVFDESRVSATVSGGSVLQEIESRHWVGCRMSVDRANQASLSPDVDYRRQRP